MVCALRAFLQKEFKLFTRRSEDPRENPQWSVSNQRITINCDGLWYDESSYIRYKRIPYHFTSASKIFFIMFFQWKHQLQNPERKNERTNSKKLYMNLQMYTHIFQLEEWMGSYGCCAIVRCSYNEEEDSEWICIQTTLTSSFCSQWSHIIIRHKVASWIHSKFSHKVSKNGIKLSFQFKHFS